MTPDSDRDLAVRNARHSNEYLAVSRCADPRRRKPALLASAEFCAEQAFLWARRLYGFRDAVISADGLLVVLVLASAAGIARRGYVVTIEHEIDPRSLNFRREREARKFLRDAAAIGARRAARAVDRDLAPAEQVELFPLDVVGCLA